MSEKSEIFVGIDVSKDTLELGFQPCGQSVELPHDGPGLSEATRRLREAEPRLVVLEATGGLEAALAASLLAVGVAVAVVNPRQVRDYAKATGQLAKTDRIDALVLADFARAIRPAVRPMKDEVTRALGDLITRRRQLVEMRVQETLRLGRASKVQQKSLKSHIAWLDKRIEDIDTDVRKRLRESPAWRIKRSRFNYDLHRASGLWVWLMLFVLAWSSVAFGRGQRLMQAAGTRQGFVVLSEQWLFLDREHGIYQYLIRSSEDQGKGGATRVLFDANTGELKGLITPNTEANGQVLTPWLYWLHMA